MKKIKINGQEYIRVKELREEIRYLRRNIPNVYHNFGEKKQAMVHLAYNDIIKALYREELISAKTPEEVQAIMEMPGDFLVLKSIGKDKERHVLYFAGFEDGRATLVEKPEDALWFDYESMAENIMEKLNAEYSLGWSVMDMSEESYNRNKALLEAIFSGPKDES